MLANQTYIDNLYYEISNVNTAITAAQNEKSKYEKKLKEHTSKLKKYNTMNSQIKNAISTINTANRFVTNVLSEISSNMQGVAGKSICTNLKTCKSNNSSAISRLNAIISASLLKINKLNSNIKNDNMHIDMAKNKISSLIRQRNRLQGSLNAAYRALEY